MNHQVKHLILTPFNFSFFCPGVNPLTDEWMERRWQIFLDVTYSSLMSQTVMDFEWIVGFDPNTPTKWKEKINKLDGFLKIYPEKPSPHTLWPAVVKPYVDKEYLLTTRIDCDDAFAVNAIQIIQDAAAIQQPRYINFLHGFVTDGKETLCLDYESNPFISRIEKSSEAKSVRATDHTMARGTRHFQQIRDMPPIWLIYVHGLNYGWTMEGAKVGYLRSHTSAPEDALKNFNVKI